MRKIKPGSDTKFWQKPLRNFQKPESDPGLMDNKKAAGFAAGGFSYGSSAEALQIHEVKLINASRIALRDVLCADQLSYARLHGRHG